MNTLTSAPRTPEQEALFNELKHAFIDSVTNYPSVTIYEVFAMLGQVSGAAISCVDPPQAREQFRSTLIVNLDRVLEQ